MCKYVDNKQSQFKLVLCKFLAKRVIIQFWHPNSILYFSFYFGTSQSPAGPMMTALRASGFLQHQISHLLLGTNRADERRSS